jgi:hypothetical protein
VVDHFSPTIISIFEYDEERDDCLMLYDCAMTLYSYNFERITTRCQYAKELIGEEVEIFLQSV